MSTKELTAIEKTREVAAHPSKPATHRALLQRKCTCGQLTVGGDCAACQKEQEGMLRRAVTGSAPVKEVPPTVNEVLRSPGQTLDSATRNFFEPRFGHDFSQVRVHTDAKAAESARAVGALAYTVGREVVFGAGQYMPGASTGHRLLAHELTHLVQQERSEGAMSLQANLSMSQPGDAREIEANKNADRVLRLTASGAGVPVRLLQVPILQRTCADGKCDTCAGGAKDFWITAYFRRKANRSTMATIRSEINGAKSILRNCCLNLKAEFDWRFLPGGGRFDRGGPRADGDALGPWDYPESAESLGEERTFSTARGVPMLVVDEIIGAGEGTSVTSDFDKEFTGRNYFVLAVNPARRNPTCNTIAHELWHIAGGLGHDPGVAQIAACSGNDVSLTYCDALRALV